MHLQGGFGKAYTQQGVDKFYQQQAQNYSNPHRYDIERLLRKKLSKKNPYISQQSKILDLACGSGQITTPLLSYGYKNIKGTDPYTAKIYTKNTNKQCDQYSFMDVIEGCYDGNEMKQQFDCIICSYAMHLVKETMLFDFCNKISQMAQWLIIISPHKLPVIKENYGWKEVQHFVQDKIHFRAFKSYNFQGVGKQIEEVQDQTRKDKEEENVGQVKKDECK